MSESNPQLSLTSIVTPEGEQTVEGEAVIGKWYDLKKSFPGLATALNPSHGDQSFIAWQKPDGDVVLVPLVKVHRFVFRPLTLEPKGFYDNVTDEP